LLDTIGDRLMFRTTYRKFGDHQTLTMVHTVSATDLPPATTARNGIRWYEVRIPSNVLGPPTIYPGVPCQLG
jgi:hypothetical protein